MLFGTPVHEEVLRLDPRFVSPAPITIDNLADVALEQRGLTDLAALRVLNAMRAETKPTSAVGVRVFNATGDRLIGNAGGGLDKYPADTLIENGCWSLFVFGRSETVIPAYEYMAQYRPRTAQKPIMLSVKGTNNRAEGIARGTRASGAHWIDGDYAVLANAAEDGSYVVCDFIITRASLAAPLARG